jgi:hypothetical protein
MTELFRQPDDPMLGFGDRVPVCLERDVLRRIRETEVAQPPAVGEGPSVALRTATPLPQEKRFQPVLGLRADDDRVFARAHEIPHRFVLVVGDVNRSELAGAMQAREHLTVSAIGFHPIPDPLRNPTLRRW